MKSNNNKDTIGYAIGRTNWYSRTLLNKFLKEEGIDLTNEQWIVLKIVFVSPSISQTEIAEKSLKDKTNITRILDGLEKRNYIIREKDENDRRMYRINITNTGKNILKEVDPIIKKVNKISCSNLSTEEVQQLKDLLRSVSNTIYEHL